MLSDVGRTSSQRANTCLCYPKLTAHIGQQYLVVLSWEGDRTKATLCLWMHSKQKKTGGVLILSKVDQYMHHVSWCAWRRFLKCSFNLKLKILCSVSLPVPSAAGLFAVNSRLCLPLRPQDVEFIMVHMLKPDPHWFLGPPLSSHRAFMASVLQLQHCSRG